MLHVLIGEDAFSIRQALAEIKAGVGDPTVLAANTTVLDGQQVNLEQLKGTCETVPFLADKRLVIVEGLLARYEARGRSGGKKAKSSGQPDDCQAIADYARSLPEFSELVLVDGKIGNQNPLLQALMRATRVRSFPLLNPVALRQWIEQRVAGAGGSISRKAVELLARFVGNDLWVMSGEVDKLVLFTGGRCIEEEDVRRAVSYVQEANVFAMIDAIMEFRASYAQELLQQLLHQGAAPAYLLVMLARQVQLMFRVRDLRRQRKTRTDIQRALGLSSDFVLRKAWEQGERYSLARLKEVYHRLLEADLSIKTGRCEGELALNILVAELCQEKSAAR